MEFDDTHGWLIDNWKRDFDPAYRMKNNPDHYNYLKEDKIDSLRYAFYQDQAKIPAELRRGEKLLWFLYGAAFILAILSVVL